MKLTAGVNPVLKNNHWQKHSWSEKKFAEFICDIDRSVTCSFIFGQQIQNYVCGGRRLIFWLLNFSVRKGVIKKLLTSCREKRTYRSLDQKVCCFGGHYWCVVITELESWREQGRPPAVQPVLLAVRGHRAAMFFWHWSHWFQLRCVFVAHTRVQCRVNKHSSGCSCVTGMRHATSYQFFLQAYIQ